MVIGFSTGAVAKGDFRGAIEILRAAQCQAIELSALRDLELPGLCEALPNLDFTSFRHVSVHAPSRFQTLSEAEAVELLKRVAGSGLPIVMHPDAMGDFRLWEQFGNLLLIENMDKRKVIGRTVGELSRVFEELPEARMCFDIAHARQVDPTMSQAYLILTRFGNRIAQVHLSEVDQSGQHTKLTMSSTFAYPKVLHLIDSEIPVILESMVRADEIADELQFAKCVWSLRGKPASASAR